MAMQKKKKQIKLKLVDWFKQDDEECFFSHWLIKMLSQKYDIVYTNKPDFIIYNANACGYEHERYDCVRIAYTIENIRIDYNIADYGINFDFMTFEDRHLRIAPFWATSKDWGEHYNFKSRNITTREKFCCYMVSHSGASFRDSLGGFRDRFFDVLSKYKRVDSGGGWRNNIGGMIDNHWSDDWTTNKHKWLENYKFNICFENSSSAGILTEKLFDAYMAGCIPIYWGDTSLRLGFVDEFSQKNIFNPHDLNSIDMRLPKNISHLIEYKINPKAFINAHSFPNLDALVEEVKRIDNDDKAYQAMLNEPLFLENFSPKEFYDKKILDFFDYIFSQEPNSAFRRGEGRHLLFYRNRNANVNLLQNKIIDYEKLSKNAKNIAKFYDSTHKSFRKFRSVLKFWKKS